MLATTFQELTHPDDLDLDLAHVRRLLAGEIPTYQMEKRYLHKRGHGVWVLLSVALVRDRAGLPLYFVSQVEDITASKAAVQALRESEERYRLIAENTADVIWMLDVATRRLTYVSPSVEKLRGFTAEEVLAQPFEAGLTPASLRRVDAYLAAGLAALAAGDQSASNAIVEAEMSTKDGGTVQTEVVASALTDASGRVTGVLGVTRDVSERKRAEAALQGSEERYRSLFEQSPLGIYRTTPDGRILDANPALMQMLGYASLEELRSRNLEESGFQPEYRRQAFKDAIEREGEVRGFEAIWTRNDGSRLHVRQSARAVRDAYGETLHYEGAVEDVTERKRTEESLRLRDSALTATANAVVITDTDMRIEWVNPAFTQLTGYDLEDVRGQNQRFHSGEQDAAFYEELQRTVQSGSVWHGELLNRRKDGALYSEEMTITPVRGTSGTIAHFVAVKQDITERRRLEEQLRQSQRMEAVGQLASGVAHDFNNLLQAMLSLTQMLVAHHSDPERLQADATELDHLVRRGAALTRQLLLFSRREPVRLERLDLNEVVRDGVTMLRRLLKAHVAIETFFAEGQLPVEADRGQLGQVLMNLAVNAGDAMPDGGRLAIETGSEGPMVWLKITDTGGGIPAAIRDHIFEPFFTTKGQGKGTGLGLSVVHGIVTQHGGAVTFECQEGQGTTFTVTLPRAGSAERPAEELAERARRIAPRAWRAGAGGGGRGIGAAVAGRHPDHARVSGDGGRQRGGGGKTGAGEAVRPAADRSHAARDHRWRAGEWPCGALAGPAGGADVRVHRGRGGRPGVAGNCRYASCKSRSTWTCWRGSCVPRSLTRRRERGRDHERRRGAPGPTSGLRRQAEDRPEKTLSGGQEVSALSLDQQRRLLHGRRVHRIVLEMQVGRPAWCERRNRNQDP